MATLDLDVFPMFTGLLPDGAILLELAIGDEEHLSKVTMPASEESRRMAGSTIQPLEIDTLMMVAPGLAREIDEFVCEIRRRLIERAV